MGLTISQMKSSVNRPRPTFPPHLLSAKWARRPRFAQQPCPAPTTKETQRAGVGRPGSLQQEVSWNAAR
jgi:hypothetical protein